MLARSNRVLDAEGFRRVMRGGAKTTTPHLVVYRSPLGGLVPQVGIVVSGKYGNAIKRNRVRRRIRAVMYSKIRSGAVLVDVVFRLRADAGEASWEDVVNEIESVDFATAQPPQPRQPRQMAQ